MTGGELLIDGDAGNHLGTAMRRGLVAVGGTADDGVGTRMIAGTILIAGRCGRHTGSGMRRGTIVLMAQTDDDIPALRWQSLLPTFARAPTAGTRNSCGCCWFTCIAAGFPFRR